MLVIIMAGGSGTRFWPASRAARPKQFLPIAGGKPLIVGTYERVRPMVPDERIVLVIGSEHCNESEKLFSGKPVRILAEPFGRNTAPCIGLAAKYAEFLGQIDTPLIILPADHYVANGDAFRRALGEAAEIAANGGIVTLGILPTRPETGYGYIQRGDPCDEGRTAFRVRRFVEKPDIETALGYLSAGDYYWNAGIFVATPRTLLRAFAERMPSFFEGLGALESSFDTPGLDSALKALYTHTEAISFDYAVMEKTSEEVYVLPCECGWSDVGSWLSLYELRKDNEGDAAGNVREGAGVVLDSRNSLVVSQGNRFVAVLGLDGALVVDTEDALLVAGLERSQEIREIIAFLKKEGLKALL